jgi:hypothetical protein
VVVLALAPASAWAEPPAEGVVVDETNGAPVPGATVIAERAGTIALTDADGAFRITIARDEREITVAAEGFAGRTVRLTGTKLVVRLEPASGGEVIQIHDKIEQTKPLSYELTADEIRELPGAGNDVLRALQALPGVARIPYSFGGIVLRGMSPRDTSIYVDGIEVPLAFHFGGVTSFYPSGMLGDLALVAGGFDVAYGRTQGGIVTLKTREPRTDRWRVGGAIGLLDSSVMAEGPLWGGGVIIGLRRSYFDTVVSPFVSDDTPLPSYWDAQLRTSFGDPRRDGRITPMLFLSVDRVANDVKLGVQQQVSLTSAFLRIAAPYTRLWGPTTVTITPWIGFDQLSFEEVDTDLVRQTFKRPLYPGGLRVEVLRDTAWGHVRGGVDTATGYLTQLQVNVSGPGGGKQLTGDNTLQWTDIGLWAETRYKIDGDRFAVKPGLRVEAYGLTGEVVADPRINIHQKLTPTVTLRQALGRFHQPPTPGDVDPQAGNPRLTSSYVDQASLGVDTELRGYSVSLTGFYQEGHDLGVRIRNPNQQEDFEPDLGGLGPTFELLLEKQLGFSLYRTNIGRSRSVGLELLVKRNVGRWFGMLAYTLSKAERTDAPAAYVDFPMDEHYVHFRPFELDQRHNLNLAVSTQAGKWRLGTRLQLVSGNPYSPEKCNPFQMCSPVPWAGQLPLFFQLDFRADRRWHKCWGDINFFIDIQNATNYDNVEGRDFQFDPNREVDIPGLPIVPFLGVEFLPK